MFVRQKGTSSIIDKGRTALGKHPQFASWRTPIAEGEIRANVSYPQDEARRGVLNVFVHTTEQDEAVRAELAVNDASGPIIDRLPRPARPLRIR